MKWNTTSQKLDQIPRLDNNIRISRFAGRFDGHATLNQIENASDALQQIHKKYINTSEASKSSISQVSGFELFGWRVLFGGGLKFALTCLSKAEVTCGQYSFKYTSLYFGNSVAKELSSKNG